MFGVEVTEFYLTDSDARIRNIPGYMSSLFAGGQARHRDDVDALKVQNSALTRADGSEEEVIDVIRVNCPRYLLMCGWSLPRLSARVRRWQIISAV
jgi:hypothetical protein